MLSRNIFLCRTAFFLAISILLITTTLNAQSREIKAILKAADHAYSRLQYKQSAALYENVLKKDAGNNNAVYGLGNTYLQLSNFKKALVYYEKLEDVWKDSVTYMNRYIQTLIANGEYKRAGNSCNQYLSSHPSDNGMAGLVAQLKHLDDLYKDSSDWKIGFVSINSNYRDFSPVLYNKGLAFVSTRTSENWKIRNFKYHYVNLKNANDFAKIYYVADTANIGVEPVGPGSEVKPKTDAEIRYLPVSVLDEERMNVGPLTFSNDGRTIYYTINKKIKEHTSWLEIMSADFKNGMISNSRPFAYNEDRYSVEHPALSPDGRYLYFTSNKPGGTGGFDLYSCEIDSSGKNWNAPKNLGNLVNTGGNEMFPSVDSAGNLYFSSDGLPGIGAMDIFYVRMKEGLPAGVPKNLGVPFNSTFDDFGITAGADGKYGYFSSNRRDENDDIYRYDAVIKPKHLYIKGTVFDEVTKLRINEAGIILKDNDDHKTRQLLSDSAGNFTVALNKETVFNSDFSKEGYTSYSTDINTAQLPDRYIAVYLKPIVKKEKVDTVLPIPPKPSKPQKPTYEDDLVRLIDSLGQTIVKRYIVHYGFDSSIVTDRKEIDTLNAVAALIRSNKGLHVVVASFTDCHGNIPYNIKLSERRSSFVRKYLRNKGVSDQNINTEYFGKSHPVLDCKEDSTFNKAIQRANRRSEIIITKDKNAKWPQSSDKEVGIINDKNKLNLNNTKRRG